jgi:hypothetical protein
VEPVIRNIGRATIHALPHKKGDHLEFYRAELINELEIPMGTTFKLESLRQAVVPPYLMLMPFIELPQSIHLEGQYALGEDGIHGCIYLLKTTEVLEGDIFIGFRDVRTNEVTHHKLIHIKVY